MRSVFYFRNLIAGSLNLVVNTLMQMVLRWFFIKTLGAEFLGLSGLFTNIFAMLSLVDLGIGGVIGFSLYKPLAQDDKGKVVALIRFYRKIYASIAGIVLILGLAAMPFLSFFINTTRAIENLNILYLITLLTTVSGYFFSYNQILLNADQRGYVATRIVTVFNIANSLVLILVLVFSKSYTYYLIATFAMSVALQMVIYKKVKVMYSYIYQHVASKITKDDYRDIISKVKGMFLHRIGDFANNSTDNLIISKFVNLVSVGYLSNYLMILTMASRFIDMVFTSMVAGVGQMLAEENRKHAARVFDSMNFLSFWLYGVISVGFYCLASPVIFLFFGENYVLSSPVVGIIALNFFLTGMRIPPHIVKSAAGVFVQDRFVPIIQSILNLVISIVAVQYWGLFGVFAGTLASSILPSIARPYVACKYGLQCSSKQYFTNYFKYLMIFITLGMASDKICSIVFPFHNWYSIPGRVLLILLVFNLPIFIIFRNSEDVDLIKSKANLFVKYVKEIIYA